MQEIFKKRREQWMEQAGEYSMGLWIAPPQRVRNSSVEYLYRQHSNLLYLLGFEEPGTVLVLRPSAEEKMVLFVRELDPDMEIWTGKRMGPEKAKEFFGADEVYTYGQLKEKLPSLFLGCERLHYSLGFEEERDRDVLRALHSVKRNRRLGKKVPTIIQEHGVLLNEMRLFKDSHEFKTMKRAAEISIEAHKQAMLAAKPGVNEREIAALLEFRFRQGGGTGPSYNTIVGRGENATFLHYIENNQDIEDGDLVLIDAGAEFEGYSSDITRTFPANGKFTEKQKQIYSIVLDALKACLAVSKPGNRVKDIHETATRVMTKGLLDLGILEGDLDTLIEEKAIRPYFMHGTGHWLGLDVHDVGSLFDEKGESRLIEPGMVFTIEPGLYFNSMHIKEAGKPYEGIGIRIEDNVFITEEGHVNLTEGVPKEIDEVEAWLATREG